MIKQTGAVLFRLNRNSADPEFDMKSHRIFDVVYQKIKTALGFRCGKGAWQSPQKQQKQLKCGPGFEGWTKNDL